ncbi:MAG: hypothetical protein WCT85_05105, partial [Parachlamydiales bacterium]
IQNHHLLISQLRSLSEEMTICISAIKESKKTEFAIGPISDEALKSSHETLHSLLKKLKASFFKEGYERLMRDFEKLKKKVQNENDKAQQHLEFLEQENLYYLDVLHRPEPNNLKKIKTHLEKLLEENRSFVNEFNNLASMAALEEFDKLDKFHWAISNGILDKKCVEQKVLDLSLDLNYLLADYENLESLIRSVESLYKTYRNFNSSAINFYNVNNDQLDKLASDFEDLLKKMQLSSFEDFFLKIDVILKELATTSFDLYFVSSNFFYGIKALESTGKFPNGLFAASKNDINSLLQQLENLFEEVQEQKNLDEFKIDTIKSVYAQIKEEQKQRKELQDFIK